MNLPDVVSRDESVVPREYNYRTKAEREQSGMSDSDFEQLVELPGLSAFLRDGDSVFHTYSTYARGTEQIGGAAYFLDLTTVGRQEEWEEPTDRVTGLGAPAGSDRLRYPDEYDE